MNWGELRKVLALVFINIFALYYDGQWLYPAILLDATVLGFELKNHIPTQTQPSPAPAD